MAEYAEISQVEMYNAFISDKKKQIKIGVIYKFRALEQEIAPEFYLGSSKNLHKRKCVHNTFCDNPESAHGMQPVYQYVRSNGGFDAWGFDLLEENIEFIEKSELLARERYWIELLKPTLNCKIPGRTKAEYRVHNAERAAIQREQRYIANRESDLQRSAEYHVANLDQIKARKKQYRQDNPEKVKEQAKIAARKRAALASAIAMQKVTCECGAEITCGGKTRHMKTQKHITLMEAL